MVWSKQATVVLALTALVVMSIVIVPVAVRSQNNRESSLSASTGEGQAIDQTIPSSDGQTITSFPSSIPSSAPPTAPLSTAPPSSVPTIPVQKRLGSDYPSRVPSGGLGSDYPSRVPSGGGDSDESDETTLELPSDIPSSTPSDVPSSAPISSSVPTPTVQNRLIGSDYPSLVPSSVPSSVPTDLPSDIPSSAPSDAQSSVPTKSVQQPDLFSDFPSMVPSSVPTARLGSDYPSIVPSSWGTPAPTVNTKREVAPSDYPSQVPSLGPSKSAAPSDEPSEVPSVAPSDEPSMVPTAAPSKSAFPSSMPSLVPSGTPSISAAPSSGPSVSARPTSVHSAVPTESSEVPSTSPSTSDPPSLVPSAQPSEYVFRRGGTIVAIAGIDYTILATDGATGLSGPLVLGEDVTRMAEITDTTTLASQGCKSGVDQLITSLTIRKQIQERFGGQPLTTADVVQMISGVVYNRRFNSCVDTNILGAIDVNGYGSVFRYDDVGRFKRVAYAVDGPEQVYIENFLLNSRSGGLTKDMIVDILQNAFISATARELETGEQLEIQIITSTGVQRIMRDL